MYLALTQNWILIKGKVCLVYQKGNLQLKLQYKELELYTRHSILAFGN